MHNFFLFQVRLYNSVVAFIATCLELYVVLPTSFNDLNSIRYILLLRTLRIFFFVVSLPRFRRIGRTLARLQQPFGVVLAFLVLIVALFASVGVHVFGGAIYVGSKALAGSDFEAAGYAAMNFNDFPSALVTVSNTLAGEHISVLSSSLEEFSSRNYSGVFVLPPVIHASSSSSSSSSPSSSSSSRSFSLS